MIKITSPLHISSTIYTYDLTESAEIVRLIGEAVKNNNACLALGIKNVIAHKDINKIPDWKIILEVKECVKDNFSAMSKMIGTSLCQRIKCF